MHGLKGFYFIMIMLCMWSHFTYVVYFATYQIFIAIMQGVTVALDCRSTGRASDPASGAWFISTIHLFTPGCNCSSIDLQRRIVALNTIHFMVTSMPTNLGIHGNHGNQYAYKSLTYIHLAFLVIMEASKPLECSRGTNMCHKEHNQRISL